MHLITIVFGSASTSWALLFKDEEKAKTVREGLAKAREFAKGVFTTTDDFGQTADILVSSIHGVMLENLDESQLASIERGLHQARGQAKAQKLARTDPVLSSFNQGGGPAVLTPQGMNGRGF